jgi:hypothetical protein
MPRLLANDKIKRLFPVEGTLRLACPANRVVCMLSKVNQESQDLFFS